MRALTPSMTFAIARICMGLFLAYYSLATLPYAADLYSSEGIIPDPRMSPAIAVLPHWLLGLDSPWMVRGYVLAQLLAAIALTLGFYRRAASLVLFVIGWWMLQRNLFSTSPEYGLIQWLQLSLVFLPSGEALSLRPRPRADWAPPLSWRFAAWLALGAAYTYSGLSKLETKIWLDGRAVRFFLENSDAVRAYLWGLDLAWADGLLRVMTRIVLVLELAALPAIFASASWLPLWLFFASMHFLNLFIFDFTQLSAGCLIFHLFLFEARWLPMTPKEGRHASS